MGVDIHFILLCETFLITENAGYKFIHQSRTTISRGGVAMYISDDFNFKDLIYVLMLKAILNHITAEIETKQGKHNLIISEIECHIQMKDNPSCIMKT